MGKKISDGWLDADKTSNRHQSNLFMNETLTISWTYKPVENCAEDLYVEENDSNLIQIAECVLVMKKKHEIIKLENVLRSCCHVVSLFAWFGIHWSESNGKNVRVAQQTCYTDFI